MAKASGVDLSIDAELPEMTRKRHATEAPSTEEAPRSVPAPAEIEALRAEALQQERDRNLRARMDFGELPAPGRARSRRGRQAGKRVCSWRSSIWLTALIARWFTWATRLNRWPPAFTACGAG